MEDDDEGVIEVPDGDVESNQEENHCAQISVQAIDGVAAFQTMRLTGHHGKKELQLLLDSGSTHNFIDSSKALKLDCKVENTPAMWVKVTNGSQLKSNKMIKGFNWRMQEVEFEADVLLLPLGGSDLVLGIQWFSMLGPVFWDFSNLTMQFTYRGSKVKLRGSTGKKLEGIQAKQLNKLVHNTGELSMLQLIPCEVGNNPQLSSLEGDNKGKDVALLDFLKEFDDVFQEPKKTTSKHRRF